MNRTIKIPNIPVSWEDAKDLFKARPDVYGTLTLKLDSGFEVEIPVAISAIGAVQTAIGEEYRVDMELIQVRKVPLASEVVR